MDVDASRYGKPTPKATVWTTSIEYAWNLTESDFAGKP